VASREAVVCVGNAGINGLATVRSLGRRGVPVQVVTLKGSSQIASASRYCSGFTEVAQLGSLHETLRKLSAHAEKPPVLFIDNDQMMKTLEAHAAELRTRFCVVDPIGRAARLTDKAYQLRIAAQAGIAVPRSWFPQSWFELRNLSRETGKRLIAKPSPARVAKAAFKALIAASSQELEARLRRVGAAAEDVIVQEFIEGDDAQIHVGLCYRARHGGRSFVLTARKLRQTQPGAGVMAVGEATDVPQVREMTQRLADSLDLRGVLSTEFKLDAADGRFYFIEWNPRPAYFQSLGWKSGFDLAWLAYCDHAGPARLAEIDSTPRKHYWINLQADLTHLACAPRTALSLSTWKPYLGPTQWAVLAADDLAPWARAMRHMIGWLSAKVARKIRTSLRGAAGRSALPPSAA
jgi:predicted ATP-grasp superfamily ATP-dependent carboligase